MKTIRCALLAVTALLLAAPLLPEQASVSSVNKQIEKLRSLSADQRPAATIKVAGDIRTLRAGKDKVECADYLVSRVTEGDQGAEALQAVADTLAQALAESPQPAKKDQPPSPYLDLASLARYKNAKVTLDDPLYAKAMQILIDNDADVQKADFTLKDLNNKKYTLSELKGKIVLVNFWATWCAPCREEMPTLDWLYTRFQSQGLVVLSITSENGYDVASFMGPIKYHPPVLIDTGGKVNQLFHIKGIPKTFFFDRDGKLLGETIDQCTQRQFIEILSNTTLIPDALQ